MAEPVLRMELDLVPVEQGYADREAARLDQEWGQIVPPATTGGTERPQDAPEAPEAPPQPSAVAKGAQAGAQAVTEGASRFGRGLMDFLAPVEAPGEPVLGGEPKPAGIGKTAVFGVAEKAKAAGDMAMGLLGILASPGVAVGAGLEQALKNVSPEQAKLEVFPGGPGGLAPLIRSMAGDSRPFGTDPEARKAGEAPMTLGEVVNLVGQLGTMAAPGAVRQTRRAMTTPERGSVTLPPGSPQGAPGFPPSKPGAAPESRVNVARVSAPESTKQVMAAVNRLQSDRLAAHRKTVSHEQTISEARPLTVEQALDLDPMKLSLEEAKSAQLAVRDVYNAAGQHVDGLVKGALRGDEAAAAQLPSAWAVLGELAVKDEILGATGARLLESRKILSEAGRSLFDPADVVGFAEMVGAAEANGFRLAERIAGLTKEQRKTFLVQAVNGYKAGQNMLYEAWINALLSGPMTHAANMLSNALTAVWAPAERFLSANLDFGANRAVFRGEAAAMMRGALDGIGDGVRIVGNALRNRQIPQRGLDKVEIPPAITAEVFGLAPDNPVGAAVDFMGMVIRSPGSALRLEDAFFKAVNYRMELYAQAYREAALEGLEGAAFARRMQQLIDSPPSVVKARADQFALVQTFNAEFSGLSGRLGSAVMAFANNAPMGRVIVPFVRTPTNILQYVGQRTPILNLLSETLRADVAAGGARRAQAFGKVAGGALVASFAASLAAAGIITGGGPKEPNLKRALRDTGWQPYSIKIGDTYYAYSRLDPLGSQFGILADAVEILGELPEYEAYEVAAAVVLAVSKHMTSKTYLEGLSSVLESLQEPDRSTKKVAQGWARSLVPTFFRQAEGVLDPILREARSLLDQVRAGVPGWSETLPPRRNLWGDPIQLGGGWGPDLISPIYTSPVKDDPVSAEIVRHKVSLSMPPRTVAGTPPPGLRMTEPRAAEGVRLTPEEYDRLVVLAGKEVKDPEGRNLHEALAALIASAEYARQSDGPDGGKALMIQRTVRVFKEQAVHQLREESPALDEAMRRAKAERLIRRAPKDQQSGDPIQQLMRTLGR